MSEDKSDAEKALAAAVKVKNDLNIFYNETTDLIANFTKLGLYIRNADKYLIRDLLNEEIGGTSLELFAPVVRVSLLGALDKSFQVIADNLAIRARELGITGNLSSGESSPGTSNN